MYQQFKLLTLAIITSLFVPHLTATDEGVAYTIISAKESAQIEAFKGRIFSDGYQHLLDKKILSFLKDKSFPTIVATCDMLLEALETPPSREIQSMVCYNVLTEFPEYIKIRTDRVFFCTTLPSKRWCASQGFLLGTLGSISNPDITERCFQLLMDSSKMCGPGGVAGIKILCKRKEKFCSRALHYLEAMINKTQTGVDLNPSIAQTCGKIGARWSEHSTESISLLQKIYNAIRKPKQLATHEFDFGVDAFISYPLARPQGEITPEEVNEKHIAVIEAAIKIITAQPAARSVAKPLFEAYAVCDNDYMRTQAIEALTTIIEWEEQMELRFAWITAALSSKE